MTTVFNMQALAAQRQASQNTACPGYVSIASGIKPVCTNNGKYYYTGAYGPVEAEPVPGETVNGKQKFRRKQSGGRRSRRVRKTRRRHVRSQ